MCIHSRACACACRCDYGFHPRHVQPDCRGAGHTSLPLPFPCAVDHVLEPVALLASPYRTRERSFLRNPRTPRDVLEDVVHVRSRDRSRDRTGGRQIATNGSVASPRVVQLRARGERAAGAPTAATLVEELGALGAVRRLHFDDIEHSLDPVLDLAGASRHEAFHKDAQKLLGSWCCSALPAYKGTAGLVRYLLPPLRRSVA